MMECATREGAASSKSVAVPARKRCSSPPTVRRRHSSPSIIPRRPWIGRDNILPQPDIATSSSSGPSNVEFQRADLYDLPFDEGSFDDAFVCFVLEHLREPGRALGAVRRVVRPGGTLTVIEGDHGSWYCHPQTKLASRAVRCLIDIQDELGGDSLIGRRLYPLLVDAGFVEVRVTPRQVYVDGSRPDLIEAFSRNTFIAMVEGVRDVALTRGYMTTGEWDQGIADLYRATAPDGTFCYTFFRGTATRSQERAKEPGA